MPTIRLIVTGDMEKLALHHSLRRCFPQADWLDPLKMSGTTSHRLMGDREPNSPMLKLAKAMIAEVRREQHSADLIIVIDDVEVGNMGQEEVVANHFRKAVETGLMRHPDEVNEIKRKIRTRCSFHLLNPMAEAYLFGDINALQYAGVSLQTPPRLAHPTDVEQFESNDPLWLPKCHQENTLKQQTSCNWWRHECHPKHYLTHLIDRNNEGRIYNETKQGREALEKLSWQIVPKCNQDTRCIRALFQDLADWFGIPNPIGVGEVHPAFYPDTHADPATLLLRNM
jgi:hypothetical protein